MASKGQLKSSPLLKGKGGNLTKVIVPKHTEGIYDITSGAGIEKPEDVMFFNAGTTTAHPSFGFNGTGVNGAFRGYLVKHDSKLKELVEAQTTSYYNTKLSTTEVATGHVIGIDLSEFGGFDPEKQVKLIGYTASPDLKIGELDPMIKFGRKFRASIEAMNDARETDGLPRITRIMIPPFSCGKYSGGNSRENVSAAFWKGFCAQEQQADYEALDEIYCTNDTWVNSLASIKQSEIDIEKKKASALIDKAKVGGIVHGEKFRAPAIPVPSSLAPSAPAVHIPGVVSKMAGFYQKVFVEAVYKDKKGKDIKGLAAIKEHFKSEKRLLIEKYESLREKIEANEFTVLPNETPEDMAQRRLIFAEFDVLRMNNKGNYREVLGEIASKIYGEPFPKDIDEGYLKMFKDLVEVDPKFGLVCLNYLAYNNEVGASYNKLLCERILDIVIRNNPGEKFAFVEGDSSPILVACLAQGNNDLAVSLLEKKSDIDLDVQDDYKADGALENALQNTALHLAAVKGWDKINGYNQKLANSSLDVVKKLIAKGANPNIKNQYGLTALDIMVLRCDEAGIKAICASEAITLETIENAKAYRGRTYREALTLLSKVLGPQSAPNPEGNTYGDVQSHLSFFSEAEFDAMAKKILEKRDSLFSREEAAKSASSSHAPSSPPPAPPVHGSSVAVPSSATLPSGSAGPLPGKPENFYSYAYFDREMEAVFEAHVYKNYGYLSLGILPSGGANAGKHIDSIFIANRPGVSIKSFTLDDLIKNEKGEPHFVLKLAAVAYDQASTINSVFPDGVLEEFPKMQLRELIRKFPNTPGDVLIPFKLAGWHWNSCKVSWKYSPDGVVTIESEAYNPNGNAILPPEMQEEIKAAFDQSLFPGKEIRYQFNKTKGKRVQTGVACGLYSNRMLMAMITGDKGEGFDAVEGIKKTGVALHHGVFDASGRQKEHNKLMDEDYEMVMRYHPDQKAKDNFCAPTKEIAAEILSGAKYGVNLEAASAKKKLLEEMAQPFVPKVSF